MAIRILGPLDAGGPELSPRERTVLSALIVRRGTAVSPSELADACWGETPPATWPQQLRNAVARIRAKLGPQAIRTVHADYMLGIASERIDAVEFEGLVTDARRLSLEGSPDRSAAAYRRALSLWRGAPLADLTSWPPAATEVRRLEELRASAEEELLDARLRTGEAVAVIPEAERLVREEPLRENRWATLGLANYQAQRQADGLAVLRAARARLADELGVDPGPRLRELEAAMLRHDPLLTPDAATSSVDAGESPCPYRGLQAYDARDSALYFGREADVAQLTDRCRRRSVVTVVGPSGSGKSSLVRAGLIPRLQENGHDVHVMTPDADGRIDSTSASGASVLVVDQAEELFIARSGERGADLRELSQWVDAGGCLVLTLRSDFLDRATGLPSIGSAIGRGLYALSPLDELGLRDVIARPAAESGLELESGLMELILRDAGDPTGILPALSHALEATWQRREGHTLTVSSYEASGGIAGGIAQSAESVFSRLTPGEADVCRSLMMRFAERTPTGGTVRRRVPIATLTEDPTRRAVVERLVAARLVTLDQDNAVIAHEAVGRAWPRLDHWLSTDAENARILRSVESASVAWETAGRDDEDLMRGARLQATEEWLEASTPDLTETENAFIAASRARHADELRELEQRSARERTSNRRLRFALGGAAGLLVVALVSGGLAVVRGGEAVRAGEDAKVEALAATSLAIRDSDRDVAALLAVELYRRWPDDSRARSALLGSLTEAGGLTRRVVFGEESTANGAAIPGTRTVFVVADDRPDADGDPTTFVGLVDVDSGETVREFDVELPRLDFSIERDVRVSADGSTAFIQSGVLRPGFQCCMNHMNAIDLELGTSKFDTVTVDSRTGQKPALSPDGSKAYFLHFITGEPSWIDLDTGEVRHRVEHDPEDFADVPPRFNGIALLGDRLYASADDGIRVYDAATLAHTDTIPLGGPSLSDTLLLPDMTGGLIAAGADGAVRVSLPSGEVVWQRSRGEIRCVDGAVTDSRLLCVTAVGAVWAHDLETGARTDTVFDTRSDVNRTIDVLDGGLDFVTFTSREPAAVQLWRIDGMPAIADAVASGHALADGFGDAGRLVVVGTPDVRETAGIPREGPSEEGAQLLWDVVADRPTGEPSAIIRWMTDSIVARLGADGLEFEDVRTGERHPLALDIDTPEFWLESGGPGGHAFVVFSDRLVPFDPATGSPSGATIVTPYNGLTDRASVSDLGEDHVVVTWWDLDAQLPVTSVYDLTTGAELARGLELDTRSVGMPDGSVISANASRLTHSNSMLTDSRALSRSGTSPAHMSASNDGNTLLIVTEDQRVALYDTRDSRRLGDEIATPLDSRNLWPAGFLRGDGAAMATMSSEGVLVWSLELADLRDAACAMVGRDFTGLEWRTYFGDDPFASTCGDG
ncbi:hypothetical protein GCM10022200_07230 [Microbacterium awajiense]|uniref:OmpR/PhoB-type domain-containing protein n=1 Tax=Microbacterium awajiense TaxID=415214 RepID=A0ABP7A9D0_9MICO